MSDHAFAMDYWWARPDGEVKLVMTVSYDAPASGSPETCELLDAIDEWGVDRLDDLEPHVYEDARLTALSMIHEADEAPSGK